MKAAFGYEWFIRTDKQVVNALEAIESVEWPLPSYLYRFTKEPIEWYEMPPVTALDHRMSFFQEGEWNEPEMAEEWLTSDLVAPVEMANLTIALKKRCDEVYSWMDDIKRAPPVYQISAAHPQTPFSEISNINDPNYRGAQWDEITLALSQEYGIQTSADTLKKETSKFRSEIKYWIQKKKKKIRNKEHQRLQDMERKLYSI